MYFFVYFGDFVNIDFIHVNVVNSTCWLRLIKLWFHFQGCLNIYAYQNTSQSLCHRIFRHFFDREIVIIFFSLTFCLPNVKAILCCLIFWEIINYIDQPRLVLITSSSFPIASHAMIICCFCAHFSILSM
jgi:hypothetical protein